MNRTSKIIALALLSGTTFFTACKKDDKKKDGTPTSTDACVNNGYTKYLKVGNKLVYSYLDLTSSDTSMTFEVVGTSGADVYVINITGGGLVGSVSSKRYMKECNDWLLVNGSTDPTFASDKTYMLNRKVGDSWTAQTVSQYTVLEKDVTVTTPAGTFVCDKLIYEQAGAFNTDTLYYSNEVGSVKYVGFLSEYELQSKNF